MIITPMRLRSRKRKMIAMKHGFVELCSLKKVALTISGCELVVLTTGEMCYFYYIGLILRLIFATYLECFYVFSFWVEVYLAVAVLARWRPLLLASVLGITIRGSPLPLGGAMSAIFAIKIVIFGVGGCVWGLYYSKHCFLPPM